MVLLELAKMFNEWADELDSIEKKKIEEDLEMRMDINDLSEEEREEVRNGNYEPEDFAEEGDLDENDYYYEDN